ncbi:MAG: carboxypeptidase-like regulatory domain-containing protein, partial [Candidatus Cybelea sp.]
MSRFITALVAALAIFSYALPSAAAVSGLVRGTVTLDGKPVAHATVVLEGEGSKFTTQTGADGGYVFSQVPFGQYRLTASIKGTPEVHADVSLAGGSVATIDLPLSQLRQIAQTVVTAHAGAASNPPSVHQIDRSQ